MKQYDLIIIGGGPAGIGAVLQAARTGCRVLLIEQDRLGGRLNHAHWVANFPSASPRGGSGKTIAGALARQLKATKVRVLKGRCRELDHNGKSFIAAVGNDKHFSKCVLLATGLAPKELKVKGAKEALDRNVLHYYWDNIPGPLKGKRIAVIGGGEVALDQACSLSSRGALVTVLVRGKKLKTYPALLERALKLGIKIIYEFRTSSIVCREHGLSLINGNGSVFRFGAAVAAIGSVLPKPILSNSAKRLINKGLYLAGDLANPNNRQAAIALGDGVKKAELALRYL